MGLHTENLHTERLPIGKDLRSCPLKSCQSENMAGGNQKKKEAIIRKEIEQLKREKGVEREKMSVTCKELVEYIKEQMLEDFLIGGANVKDNENPWKGKDGPCGLF